MFIRVNFVYKNSHCLRLTIYILDKNNYII